MIYIIDYGMGNVGSILNMIKYVGGEATIADNPKTLESATGIILPGVGAFEERDEKSSRIWMDRIFE